MRSRIGTRYSWIGRLATAAILLSLLSSTASAQFSQSDRAIVDQIDTFLRQGWKDNEIKPSPRASDEEFARRTSLDTVGHIPSYERLMDFLEDESADKRTKYVDQLLDDEDYVPYWTNIWGNMLIGRANNRRANRGDLDRWLRDAFNRNVPYNEFVYELIAAEGDSTQNGAVTFLAAHLNDGAIPATSITSRIFLGLQVQCTQCHNHPFNDWQQSQFWSMNAFFQGTRRQGGGQRGGIFLTDNPSPGLVYYEKRSGLQQATFRMFVDGTQVSRTEDDLPRRQLAELITSPEKPYMARTQVNRLWGHFFGYGFTRPVDDMGPHNPASHPELLDFLTDEFAKAGYDQKRLMRWIAASEAYNLSSSFSADNTFDDPSVGNTPLFSKVYPKQFTAEQLYDSLIIATEAHKAANRDVEAAERQRATWLQQFVQTFGTDENDEHTSFNGTIPQALLLMNGQLMDNALSDDSGAFLQKVLDSPTGDLREKKSSKGTSKRRRPLTSRSSQSRVKNIPKKIETLFLVALSRRPTEEEMNTINRVFQEHGTANPIQGLQDVFWAILNSNEFITNH